MGNIRYQRTAHRITSAVNCRPLKPSPRSICPAAPYPTGVHIPGIPPPAKFATEPYIVCKPKPRRHVGGVSTFVATHRSPPFQHAEQDHESERVETGLGHVVLPKGSTETRDSVLAG